ncbi:HAMP domain-containing histidine kinase [Paenibacillus pasadenensis]|uniref:sensor histidine kinase n=1 Tax=Paenibacillus pasadenensis TaxID=217090 RepID=UPI0020410956|nr:HAMP domain-containing sensor histidine kinase [Paenibacillus pasadenensis]MCM3750174.1 HAMP domain-containing histidine kinase [Paenibacillus pasadenensis]
MIVRLLQSMLWKLLLRFLISIAAVAPLLWIGYTLTKLLLKYNPSGSFPLTQLLWFIMETVGSVPVMIFGGIFLFFGLFFWLSLRFLKRFDSITDGLTQIAEGNLKHRINDESSDELGTVSRTINEMAQQLQLAQAEERAAVQAKNDLITGVSHDLRTPLTSILGFLEYIQNDRYRDELELRQYVDIAYDKALVLRKLIDDLFEYTRVAGGGMPLQPERLDLNPFLGQLIEELHPLLEEAGMRCTLHPSPGPLLVSADPELLVRAFENLMTNAIRYGASEKGIDIFLRENIHKDDELEEDSPASVDSEKITGQRNEQAEQEVTTVLQPSAEIIFRNYGEPIPVNHLPHLFDRFYRVDASRSRQTGGSGIGLAIVKSIILDLHGGQIAVSSNKRRTEFVVRLPLKFRKE